MNNISLLWPNSHTEERNRELRYNRMTLPRDFILDLNLEVIAREINPNNYKFALDILSDMCNDPEVIDYRLDVLDDFINIPELEDTVLGSINSISRYQRFTENKFKNIGSFMDLASKLAGIENYIQCIKDYNDFIQRFGGLIKSQGLKRLLHTIDGIYKSKEFNTLIAETAKLRKILAEGVSSIAIGINFDQCMRPVEAVLLSAGTKPYKEIPLLAKLFGQEQGEENRYGISAFHHLDINNEYGALDSALFLDLKQISTQVMENFTNSIKLFNSLNTTFLLNLNSQFIYFVGAAKLMKNLKDHGLNMCRPVPVSDSARVFDVNNITDLPFALKLMRNDWYTNLGKEIVPNDVDMGDAGRIFILTGPNQGGKTTYARAIGVAQALFQAGLYIPGTTAHISPVDWIYTHFPKEETVGYHTSRLAEECKQFTNTFKHATRNSLMLLNESLSSTSPTECLYLAGEILKGMRYLGCRAVYATHLPELAAKIYDIHDKVQGDSSLISMVAGISKGTGDESSEKDPNKRTYKIMPNPPLGYSYAKDIAENYGVSFEQIINEVDIRKKVV